MSNTVDLSTKTIGFLGCGKISSALCRGFASNDNLSQRPKHILVSERSREKSSALATQFPDLVEVVSDNKDLVSRADIIFIGLLPKVARDELPTMPFTNDKLIISMMAAVDYAETLSLIHASPSRIVRTVPLPSAARRSGPILLYPGHIEAESVLQTIGTPVVCDTETQMKPMISITGHISSFFELMRTTQSFLMDHDIDEERSRQFVTSFYYSLSQGAEKAHESLAEMRDEAATPGGLNEQSIGFLTDSPHFALQKDSLEQILTRLTKK